MPALLIFTVWLFLAVLPVLGKAACGACGGVSLARAFPVMPLLLVVAAKDV